MEDKKVWKKITNQRTLILEYLQQEKSHPTAQKIFNEAKKNLPRISLSTIYRTLEELKKQNLVRELWIDKEAHYETNFLDHIDFFCIRCHRIIDIPMVEIMDIKRRLGEGYSVNEINFIVKGICPLCQKLGH